MASQFSRRDFLPAGLKANQVELVGNTVRIHSRSAKATAACPRCGTASRHVHSRYRRRPADLSAHGRKVELVLLVRRFRYRAPRCPAKIFAERFPPDVTRPHARRTSRLQGLVRHLGLALGGRPAQALAARLLLPVSKDTFLRSIRDNDIVACLGLRVAPDGLPAPVSCQSLFQQSETGITHRPAIIVEGCGHPRRMVARRGSWPCASGPAPSPRPGRRVRRP